MIFFYLFTIPRCIGETATLNPRINSLDLKVVKEDLMRKDGVLAEVADRTIRDYRRYLAMVEKKREDPDFRTIPGYLVDLAWHRHIQHTEKYWNDTLSVFGTYIGHQPGNDEDATAEGEADINAPEEEQDPLEPVLQLYREMFHEEPDMDLWDWAVEQQPLTVERRRPIYCNIHCDEKTKKEKLGNSYFPSAESSQRGPFLGATPKTSRDIFDKCYLDNERESLGEDPRVVNYLDNERENPKEHVFPWGRRRFDGLGANHAFYDVGTGFLYDQTADVPKNLRNKPSLGGPNCVDSVDPLRGNKLGGPQNPKTSKLGYPYCLLQGNKLGGPQNPKTPKLGYPYCLLRGNKLGGPNCVDRVDPLKKTPKLGYPYCLLRGNKLGGPNCVDRVDNRVRREVVFDDVYDDVAGETQRMRTGVRQYGPERSPEEAEAAIAGEDLSFLERRLQNKKSKSPEEAARLVEKYREFLIDQARSGKLGDSPQAADEEVEMVWAMHTLFTTDYRDFSEKAAGRYIHFMPKF